jgi:predicted dehydrogenase
MFDSNGISRRSFLKKTGAGLVAATAFPTIIPSSAFGANDRVTMAIVGIHGQGGAHLGGFPKIPDVRIKTIVDVDENLFPSRLKAFQERNGYAPGTATDMRRVLDDKDIDAVTFAIPNHWHALATIWAVQAGKHVYVEKPASHDLWEGRQMVNAARKYNRLVQVGFQNRSRPSTIAAIKLVHDGGIGKVYMARGLCYKPRGDIGNWPDGPMQPGEKWAYTKESTNYVEPYTADYLKNVHYDLWMGPAPARPFNRNRFHYNWHWQWAYGNGDTGNQGPHQFDVGRWGLNKDEYPVKVKSVGGLYIFKDSAQETPNTQTSILEYDDGTIFEFATRGLNTNRDGGIDIGNIFYGSEGRLEIDADGNWKTFMGRKDEPGPDSSNIAHEESNALNPVGSGIGDHFANFVAAVKSGKQSDLNCDIEEGVRSSNLMHISNASYRTGRELKFDGKTETFVGDDEANRYLKRQQVRPPYVVPAVGGGDGATR